MKSYPFLEPPNKPGDLGQLGHYRVIHELGKGGMGYVFRAEDVKLQRSVALKVMNQKIAATPNSRRRFIREARAMAAVHHDNVATIFEVGESKGTPFMAMEMLRGSTLEELNESKRRFGYEEIIELARQMSKGLAAAHAKGIVHRDIKPANIWIQKDSDRVKILDFGLALASSPIDSMAGRGAVVGTPGYLSPEQAMSEPLDDRSDLYSLGVVLYELCTGRLPCDASSVPSQLISILVHRPTPIGDLNSEIPKPLCNLIHHLLRKEPRSRPRSAQVLLEELDRVESECHVKSEVAQAISKLQMGLQEAVSKRSGPSIFDVEVIPDTDSDPLAIPASPQATTVPAAPMPRRPAPSKEAASAAPAWLAYWPLAAVVAVVLLALPLMTFLFTGIGQSNRPSLIVDDPISPTSPGVSAPSASSSNRRENRQGDRPDSTRPYAALRNGGSENQNRDELQSPTGPQNPNGPDKMSPPPPSQIASSEIPSPPSSASPSSTPSSAESQGKVPAPAIAAPTPPGPETKWTAISTADGRGADAMVQIGSSRKYGLNPSLAVRMRNGVENNHSYLRFDLAEIEETRRWADASELVLSVVGDERPVGATVRVYAVNAGLWREEDLQWGNSFSPRGLDSLPPMGEITVGTDPDPRDMDPRDMGANRIRIASPQLTEAIAKSTQDTLTLVLAGTAADESMLRFVSREHSASLAPRLEVRVPINPPMQQPGRTGGQRGVPQAVR